METTTKTLTCCDNQHLIVDEQFEYKCEFVDGKLAIYLNEYETEGFENLRCDNCYETFNIDNLEVEY